MQRMSIMEKNIATLTMRHSPAYTALLDPTKISNLDPTRSKPKVTATKPDVWKRAEFLDDLDTRNHKAKDRLTNQCTNIIMKMLWQSPPILDKSAMIPLTDPIDGKLNIHQWQEALQITAE